jgi:hypothetical protein
LELVGQRLQANTEIANAMAAANEANSRLQVANTRLKQLEHEVNYRMQVAAQLKGGAPTQILGPSAGIFQVPAAAYEFAVDQAGVGSIPAPAPRIVQTEPRIRGPRTESAEGVRAEEVQIRAAI